MGRSGVLTLVVGLLMLSMPAAAWADTLQPSSQVVAQPAVNGQHAHGAPARRIHSVVVPSPGLLKNGKARAGQRGLGPSSGGPGGPTPEAVVVNGLNQPGMAATDNSAANQGTPPDTTGAIGLNHYVEFVNSKVAVYTRANLNLVSTRDLDPFVGFSGDNVFDPQVQWDQQGGRWLYVNVDVDASNHNYLDFGWSKTSDPSDLVNGWCRFRFTTDSGNTRFLEDYPKLGHDNQHILIGTNSTRGNSFFTAHIYSIPKPANGVTTCTAPSPISTFGSPGSPLTTSDGDPVFTPVPANTADSLAAGYVVAADSPYFVTTPSQVMAWHVGGTATAPTLVQDGNMNVTAFDFPANVPQPGTSDVIDSSDARLTQAVAHADPQAGGAEAVWTQHTVDGPGGRSVVRWYELLPASLTVRQLGTIQDPNLFVFNGAISPASDGTTAAIDYNTGSGGSGGELVKIKAQSRNSTTALGQMSDEVLLGTSAAINQDFSCTPCRWGDYAGASPDPNSLQGIWGSSQVNGPTTTDPAWQTRNFELTDSFAGYPRPRGATPMRVSLVPAFAACTSPNRSHGAPLAFGSCAPPHQASSFLTFGTPDANGAQANAVASLQMNVIVDNPNTPADEADVALSASSTDVRLASGLGDYGGELEARVALQITDRGSGLPGGPFDQPATGQPINYSFAVPCQPTAATTVGSTCSVTTTADTLVPGTVKGGARSIWELGKVQLFDGGPDGSASTTTGNTLFETEGVFAP